MGKRLGKDINIFFKNVHGKQKSEISGNMDLREREAAWARWRQGRRGVLGLVLPLRASSECKGALGTLNTSSWMHM